MVFLLEPKLLGTICVGVNQVAASTIFHTYPSSQKKYVLQSAKCKNYSDGGFQMFSTFGPAWGDNLINVFQMG